MRYFQQRYPSWLRSPLGELPICGEKLLVSTVFYTTLHWLDLVGQGMRFQVYGFMDQNHPHISRTQIFRWGMMGDCSLIIIPTGDIQIGDTTNRGYFCPRRNSSTKLRGVGYTAASALGAHCQPCSGTGLAWRKIQWPWPGNDEKWSYLRVFLWSM